MAQLVQLVRPDRAHRYALLPPVHVAARAGQKRHGTAADRHLRERREHQRPVLVPGGSARVKHVERGVPLLRQMVKTVSIVPEQPEVRRRSRHRSETPYHLVRVDRAARVAIERHAPDALDSRIVCYLRFHEVHVRTVVVQRHVDHADAERRADREVPVVTGHRAEKSNIVVFAPRVATRHTEQHRKRQCVMHQFEARIAGCHHLIRRHIEQRRAELARFGQT